jgi:ribonuclease P protein component
MGEAPVSTEQPQTRQAPRVQAPDVDPSRQGDPLRPAAQRPAPPVRLILPIRDRATFAALRETSARARSGPVTVRWAAGANANAVHVAYSVGRRAGGAVVRNRIRRRLRAGMRSIGNELAGGAYLVAADPLASALAFADLCGRLRDAARRAAAMAVSSGVRMDAQ